MEKNTINQPTNPLKTPTQSVQQPTNNQRSRLPIVLAALVLLLVVGSGAYYVGTQYSRTGPQSQSTNTWPTTTSPNNTVTNPTHTTTQNPQNNETASWKTYSSSILSFKYPATLTLEERQKNYIVLISDANNPQSVLVSIDARQSGNYANYETAVSSTKAGLTDVQTVETTNGVNISGKVAPGYGEGQPIIIALFKYGTAAVEAETTSTNQSQLQIFNTILSTFTLYK